MFDIFVGFFANPISWIFLGIFTGLGLLIGLFLRPWVGNQVIKFIPADHRFIDLGIEEETSISIQCDKKKGMPPQRFFKLNPGYTGIVGRFLKKPITRYLGMEGTAYTWSLDAGTYHKMGSLGDAVRATWGEDFWATVPEHQKDLLTESRISVTVGLDAAPLTPAGMRSISEEDIKQEEDRRASQTFWEEHQSQMKGYFINLLLGIGTGFGICAALVLLGVISLPTPAAAPAAQPVADATAQIIRSALRMG